MRKEIICKYITIDGKEFSNEKDARVHEISLRYKRELSNIDHKTIGRYELYKIFTVDELDSLFYYNRQVEFIGQYNDLKFPFILCRIQNGPQYEFIHINDLINQHSDVLKELVRYKEME